MAKIRVADIAQLAGVSTATVDRVLNNRQGVHVRTSEQVMRAVDRLKQISDADLEGYVASMTKRKFDFLVPSGTNTFFDLMAAEVHRQSREFVRVGAELRCQRMEGFHPAEIADRLRDLAGDSDGICVVAIDHPLVREAINSVSEGGMPIVTLLTDISTTRRLGYVGVDNFVAGRLAGYLMGRFLRGQRGGVALISGSLTYRGHAEREHGFRSVLQEDFPNLKLVDSREGLDDDDQTQAQAKNLLDDHPKLLGVYNIGGGAAAVARAMSEAGKKDVVLVAHELNDQTRPFLVNGFIDVILHQNPAAEVAGAVRMLMNHCAGWDPLANVEPIRIEIFLRENVI